MSGDWARRGRALGAVVVTILLGLSARQWLSPACCEHVGNVLWGAMWAWIAVACVPRMCWWATGVVGFACCAAIEVLQLTAIPARAAEVWGPTRWLLGFGFDWWDVAGNAVGVASAAFVHKCTRAGSPDKA